VANRRIVTNNVWIRDEREEEANAFSMPSPQLFGSRPFGFAVVDLRVRTIETSRRLCSLREKCV